MSIEEKEHDCCDYRVYLDGCGECPECQVDPRTCDLVVYGICSLCGEIIKPYEDE